MDIMYPVDGSGHSRPYFIIVDHLSRYAVTCRMNSHKPEHAIDLFYKMWLQQLGRPGEILADRGPSFIGTEWDSLCDLMEIQMILIARECPRENGIAERSVGIIKTTYRILKQRCGSVSDERLIIRAAMCRNLIPNTKSGLAPSQIMLGRSDVVSMMEGRNWLPIEERSDDMLANQNILKGLLGARNVAVQADARNIIQTGTQRPLRNNAHYSPLVNDTVSVFQKALKEPRARWNHGYRVVSCSERHAILERTNRIVKTPLFQIRKNGGNCTPQPSAEGETTQGPHRLDGVPNGMVNGRRCR